MNWIGIMKGEYKCQKVYLTLFWTECFRCKIELKKILRSEIWYPVYHKIYKNLRWKKIEMCNGFWENFQNDWDTPVNLRNETLQSLYSIILQRADVLNLTFLDTNWQVALTSIAARNLSLVHGLTSQTRPISVSIIIFSVILDEIKICVVLQVFLTTFMNLTSI